MIGKRALDDPRNSLVHHFVRLVVSVSADRFQAGPPELRGGAEGLAAAELGVLA